MDSLTFGNYNLNYFSLFFNYQQVPKEWLSMDMSHEKTPVLAYNTLFAGSGFHHSNVLLQINHDIYINGSFMLPFDLTPKRGASEGTISHPNNVVVWIELKFAHPRQVPITCLLYLEYEITVFVDFWRTVTETLINVHNTDIIPSTERAIFLGATHLACIHTQSPDQAPL
jgi:hypothetical protein